MNTPPTPRQIGRYEIVGELGRGGAGQVFEAVLLGPRGFRKPVALKVVHGGMGASTPQFQSLIQEARLGAMLSHPNVVSIYELGQTEEGQLYVAMELVHGPTVLDLLRQQSLTAGAVLDIGIQVAAALQHVHALQVDGREVGLVHRDVKPSNLLVDASGLVKLTDLGVARLTGHKDAFIAGTPGYMSPEQMEGTEDRRTDLFSLGASLYVLAAGRRPFGSGSPALRRTVKAEESLADPAFLAPVDARVPGLGAVLARCLRLEPSDRYSTAAELSDALRGLRAQHDGPGLQQAMRGNPPPSITDIPPEPPLTDFPTEERPAHRLPEPVSTMVGRELELGQVLRLLAGIPVVGITGPAGAGKSRLAIEAARHLLTDGTPVWHVHAGDLREATELYARISAAIDVPLAEGDLVDRLGHSLRALGRVVFVLDDVDAIAAEASDAVTRWSELAPSVRFVLTSRRVPKVIRSATVAIEGLSLEAGCALYRERAAAPPGPNEQALLEDLVERVDGLPLAIELAAARSRVGLSQILDRLDFRILSSPTQSIEGSEDTGRFQSMRASLDASFEQLDPFAQKALGQLSVCEDGFTIEAAEAIVDLPASSDTPWALDLLDRLLDHSIVQLDPETGRFRLLHTVRVYAYDSMSAAERRVSERRHAAYYAQLGSVSAVEALHRQGGLERLQALAAERGNLAAAMGRSLANSDLISAEGVAVAMWEVLQVLGPLSAAWKMLQQTVEISGHQASARLLAAAGQAATLNAGMDAGLPLLERAIERGRATNDGVARANAEGCLGFLHRDAGNPDEAQRHLEASLVGHKVEGNRRGEGMALYRLGLLRYHQSQLIEARGLTEGAVRAFREVGDRRQEGVAMHSFALILSELGDHAGALRRGDAALAIHREQHNRHAEAVALGNQGILLRRSGRIEEARAFYEASLMANRAIGNRRLEGAILGNLGTLHVAAEEYEEAAEYYEQALVVHREVGNKHYEGVVLGNFGELLFRIGNYSAARIRLGVAIEVANHVKDRSMEGSFLAVMGQVLEGLGDEKGADDAFDEADRVLRKVKDPTALARAMLCRAETEAARQSWELAEMAIREADQITAGISDAAEVRVRLRALRARLP